MSRKFINLYYFLLFIDNIDDLRGQLAPSQEELQEARDRIEQKKEKIINFIIAHINSVEFIIQEEDDEYEGTVKDFENALALSRESDLDRFNKSHSLPFESGYIKVNV